MIDIMTQQESRLSPHEEQANVVLPELNIIREELFNISLDEEFTGGSMGEALTQQFQSNFEKIKKLIGLVDEKMAQAHEAAKQLAIDSVQAEMQNQQTQIENEKAQ